MQTFKDSATGKVWAFDDDVAMTSHRDGTFSFRTRFGMVLKTPSTLERYTVPAEPNHPKKSSGKGRK